MDKILNLGKRKVYENGTTLYDAGKPVENIYYVEKGLVQLTIGDWGILSLAERGSLLGLMEASCKSSYLHTAKVVGKSVIIELNKAKFMNLFFNDPDLRTKILRNISQEKNFNHASFE